MSDVKVFEATRSGPNSRRRVKSTGFQAPERIRVAAYVRVSTDDDEQLGSFESQKSYYEDKIRENKEWAMAGIFADEAITGTNVNKREQFLEMIDRCMAGEIDMILTKSISRFARNTLDTLNYVRMLKDKNIAVIFEKENIDTLTMNGELMLTILSSLARGDCDIDDKEKYLKAWKGLKQGTSEFLPDGGAVFGSPFLCLCELIEGRKSWIINCFWQGFGKETIVSNWLLISRREKGGPERKEADTERYPARLPAHLLQQPGEGRNEPEDAAIPHGSLGDRGDDVRLHTPGARGSCRGDGQDGASRERKKRAGEDFRKEG